MTQAEPRMTPVVFHLLLALADGARHGYALMQEIERRTEGRVRLGPSSLYYSLGKLEDAKWIEETAGPSAGARRSVGSSGPHEGRRRYYRLTAAGRSRLRREMTLLADIVAHARARRLIV